MINENKICFLLLASLSLQAGCASKSSLGKTSTDFATTESPTLIGTKLNSHNFAALIDQNTRHDQQYDGFYNKFEIYATFLNSNVQSAILQKKSEALNWDAKQAQTEREKLFQENSNQTKFAVSFFVPSVRLNDLHKKASIWRVYLDVGGKRYEGRVLKRNGKLEDIQTLFNYHSRWSVAYDIIFDIPLSGVEGQNAPVNFVLTSTQGAIYLKF